MARRPARSGERRPLRDPRAREEPGVLAHRRRRAHARHRPERRRLHDAQGHGAQPARRRRRVGAARTSSSARRAPGRQRRACRIPTISTFAITTTRSRDSSARARSRPTWAEAEAPARSGPSSSPATTFRSSAFAPQRGRTLLPSDEIAPGRHPVVVHQRWSVAARFRRRSGHRRQDGRDQQLPADGRGRGRSDVPRHDRESTTSKCSFR